jgi:hypothetical protein
MMREMGV